MASITIVSINPKIFQYYTKPIQATFTARPPKFTFIVNNEDGKRRHLKKGDYLFVGVASVEEQLDFAYDKICSIPGINPFSYDQPLATLKELSEEEINDLEPIDKTVDCCLSV